MIVDAAETVQRKRAALDVRIGSNCDVADART